MKYAVKHPTFGEIIYEEGFWSGKKRLFVRGRALERTGKNAFLLPTEEGAIDIVLNGNTVTGVSFALGGERYSIVPKPTWYELLCSISIFVLILIWGNSKTLCSIFPVVGGAIGGAISGLMAMTCLVTMKLFSKPLQKLLVWLLALAATVLLCFGIAALILMMA